MPIYGIPLVLPAFHPGRGGISNNGNHYIIYILYNIVYIKQKRNFKKDKDEPISYVKKKIGKFEEFGKGGVF